MWAVWQGPGCGLRAVRRGMGTPPYPRPPMRSAKPPLSAGPIEMGGQLVHAAHGGRCKALELGVGGSGGGS